MWTVQSLGIILYREDIKQGNKTFDSISRDCVGCNNLGGNSQHFSMNVELRALNENVTCAGPDSFFPARANPSGPTHVNSRIFFL